MQRKLAYYAEPQPAVYHFNDTKVRKIFEICKCFANFFRYFLQEKWNYCTFAANINTDKNMYIPRGMIYEDLESLEDFEIDRQGTLDYAFYEALQQVGKIDEKWPESLEEEYVYMFNDAYYISLLILRERRPELEFDGYCKLASELVCMWRGGQNLELPLRGLLVMSMVYSILDVQPGAPPSVRRFMVKLRAWIDSDKKYAWVPEYISSRVHVQQAKPLVAIPVTPSLLNTLMWHSYMTFMFDDVPHKKRESKIRHDVMFLGKNLEEKLLIIDSMLSRPGTKLFYNSDRQFLKTLREEVIANNGKDDIDAVPADTTPEEEEEDTEPCDVLRNKVCFELFLRLLESAGFDINNTGNKTRAGQLWHMLTGKSSEELRQFCGERDYDNKNTRADVKRLNSKLAEMGIDIVIELPEEGTKQGRKSLQKKL